MTAAGIFSPRLLQMLTESARRGSELHHLFLQNRRRELQTIRAFIEMQIAGSSQQLTRSPRPAIFDSWQLDAFGTGKVSDCLGAHFARYDGMRIPRIPNGDLKMMSRITAISGQARNFSQPASITAEYDALPDAWYFQEGAYPQMPVSLYMEIALQPCGFLSAYLDTYALAPQSLFFFRNLDGEMQFFEPVDLRGKTIVTEARLLSSVAGGGTVIQKFAFSLSCEGRRLCTGESTFGYFSADAMANQLGLDGGRQALPAIKTDPELARSAVRVDVGRLQSVKPDSPYYRLPSGRLHLVQDIAVAPGGKYGGGYVYASRPVNPQDWFYPFHFYQDPVMPGSLGVEAMLEALQAYALEMDLGRGLRAPRFGLVASPEGAPLQWSYRGQITQQHKLMELELHLKPAERQPGRVILSGDASLWVDGLRIYSVKNAALGILQA